MKFQSTKVIELGSCAFRQPKANHSHCRFIHGYRLTAKFWFSANELDEHNWVVDFGGLKGLKDKLRNQFDHTTCIAADDPALPVFKELEKAGACDLRVMPTGTGIERIAQWCYDTADFFIKAATNNRCWVENVEVSEHEDNSAVFTRIVTQTMRYSDEYKSEDVDWNAYREAEACGPQANPKDFVKSTPVHELGEANDPIVQGPPLPDNTPSEAEQQASQEAKDDEAQRNLPGAKRTKSVGARIGPAPVSHDLSDPFAGTSWGSDKPGDPYAPKRG
jgi:6-pyruvoyltetrahydropterin/6-carboxytetrahydropterin synthase